MNGLGHLIKLAKPVLSPIRITSIVFWSRSHSCWTASLSSDWKYFYQPSRGAGHSKWANIKHTKAAKDSERSAQTSKFVNMIKIAIREGGGSIDPKINSKLAGVISQIKDAKLSMTSFENTLQKESKRSNEKRLTLVFKGPGNCVLITEISSDMIIKTKQELNVILKKNKGIVADDSILRLFDHKGIILSSEVNGSPVNPDNLDNVIADAIEAGADDVTFQSDHPEFGNVFEFSTSPDVFFKTKHALEKLKYTIAYADLDYIPHNPIELDDVVIQDALKLCQKLEDHPNVIKVSTNIA